MSGNLITMTTQTRATPRPLHEIAREIRSLWRSSANYAALPYIQAMTQVSSIEDDFGFDSARSVVQYFLSNATSWRGPDARRIKAELKALL